MLFKSAIFSGLLLVPTVLAVPSTLDARLARRREGRLSQFVDRRAQAAGTVDGTEYDFSWAGAILTNSNGTFTSVTGTFTVPTPSGASGTSASAWVGIDGSTCQSAALQTGVVLSVSSNGQPTYGAWYEWYPASASDFSGITISAGDIIKLTVTATSATSGTATIENQTNCQTVSEHLSSSSPLCGQNAEWIVEDYVLANGDSVSLTNFGTVSFTNAEATGTGTYTPSDGATIVDIEQNNAILTSTSISGSSVTIQYV